MTEREFAEVFGKLALQLRWNDPDESAIRGYFDALEKYPLDVVKQAANTLALERGRKFFPTTGEWCDAIGHARAEEARAASAAPRTWTVECEECDDCGWQHFECTGDSFCGRTNPHLPHTFVRICPCRATNRTYQRHNPRVTA